MGGMHGGGGSLKKGADEKSVAKPNITPSVYEIFF